MEIETAKAIVSLTYDQPSGSIIPAIKMLRDEAFLGLRESKEMIELGLTLGKEGFLAKLGEEFVQSKSDLLIVLKAEYRKLGEKIRNLQAEVDLEHQKETADAWSDYFRVDGSYACVHPFID